MRSAFSALNQRPFPGSFTFYTKSKLMHQRLLVRFKYACILVLMLFSSAGVFAQANIQVKGKITDVNGLPLPNVTVLVKGTETGVASDASGNFSIAVPNESAVLVVSNVGFQS